MWIDEQTGEARERERERVVESDIEVLIACMTKNAGKRRRE